MCNRRRDAGHLHLRDAQRTARCQPTLHFPPLPHFHFRLRPPCLPPRLALLRPPLPRASLLLDSHQALQAAPRLRRHHLAPQVSRRPLLAAPPQARLRLGAPPHPRRSLPHHPLALVRVACLRAHGGPRPPLRQLGAARQPPRGLFLFPRLAVERRVGLGYLHARRRPPRASDPRRAPLHVRRHDPRRLPLRHPRLEALCLPLRAQRGEGGLRHQDRPRARGDEAAQPARRAAAAVPAVLRLRLVALRGVRRAAASARRREPGALARDQRLHPPRDGAAGALLPQRPRGGRA
mmetsp:Transcript_19660/g.49090  ORF Transcript_19660/g.49090 Transcript_19660/m.49090 type:complete len:292 (-) Transcript_19660:3069-3944(-)